MKLSVIVPVFNEIGTIEKIVDKVQAVHFDKEIIIIDDFSKDGTREKVSELAGRYDNIRALYQEYNQGKGAALQSGFAHASGDVIEVTAGTMVLFPAGWKGVCTVHQTMRNVYMLR